MANDIEHVDAEVVELEFELDDFLDGTEPYESIYKHHDDAFEEGRILEKVAKNASLVGFKGFKTAYKNYCKKMKKISSDSNIENATNFEGQKIELNCGSWTADEYGITRETYFGEEVACTHPIMPIMRLINVDSGLVKIVLAYRKGNVWYQNVFDRETLASASKIVSLANYGISVNSENAKSLVKYLMEVEDLNYDNIETKKSVSRLGWIGRKEFSPYVESLKYDGDLSFKYMFESVKQEGTLEEWKSVIAPIRKSKKLPAHIMLAASFASVLVEPLGCLPFFVHAWGGSGNGKSVALLVAASVWATPEMGKYVHTFNSTAVAQELQASFVNSLPLMLDELQMIKDKRNFDKTIYQLAEGVGRSRGAKLGGLQKTSTWHNCIVTNGERPISSAESNSGAINRIIELNCCDEKLFDSDPMEILDALKTNYGTAGRAFVEYVQDDEVMKECRKMYKLAYQDFLKDYTEKQSMAAALLIVADFMAEKCIFNDGGLLTEDSLKQYLSTQEEVDQNHRAYEWLQNWLAQNRSKFLEVSDDNKTETWGVYTNGYVYILKNIFDKACNENGFDPNSFLSWMRKRDMLDHRNKRNTKMQRVNGENSNCVCIIHNEDENVDIC